MNIHPLIDSRLDQGTTDHEMLYWDAASKNWTKSGANLTWNNATNTLGITGALTVDTLTFDDSTITSSADNDTGVLFIYASNGEQVLILQNDAAQPRGIGIGAGNATSGNNDGGGITMATGAGDGTGVGGTFTLIAEEDGDMAYTVSGTGEHCFTGDTDFVNDVGISGRLDVLGEIDGRTDVLVATGGAANYGLILKGYAEAAGSLGGNIELYKNADNSAGFLFANNNNALVWSTARSTGRFDTGKAWVEFDTGNCSFDEGAFTFINGVLTVIGVSKFGGGVIYTPTSTQNIVAATGITAAMITSKILRVQSSTAGNADISATPQIADGTNGQVVRIYGEDDTKTVQLDDGNGLQLAGSVSFTLGLGDVIQLTYFSSVDIWREDFRSDN